MDRFSHPKAICTYVCIYTHTQKQTQSPTKTAYSAHIGQRIATSLNSTDLLEQASQVCFYLISI